MPNASPKLLLRATDSVLSGRSEVAASSYLESRFGMSEIAAPYSKRDAAVMVGNCYYEI